MGNYLDTIANQNQRPYINIATGLTVGGLALLIMYYALNLGSDGTGLNQLIVLGLIQLTPAILTFLRGGVSFIAFIMVNHFVVYTMAKFNLIVNLQKLTVIPQDTLNAFVEMTNCTLFILFAYYTTRLVSLQRHIGASKFESLYITERVYFWVGMYVIFHPFISSITPTSFYTLQITSFALCLIVLLCSDCSNPFLMRWMRVGIIVSSLQNFILFGSLSVAGNVAATFFIVSMIQRKIGQLLILTAFVVVGLLFQSVKFEYRLLSRAENDTLPISDRMEILQDVIAWKYLGDVNPNPELLFEPGENLDEKTEQELAKDTEIKEALTKGLARVGDDSLERVLAMTPSIVPFWEGETYVSILYSFIPRFLWPGKPTRDMWNKFGRKYGFLSADDFDTSVGVNFLGEGFMNFGYFGLYTVALLFGFLAATLEKVSNVILGRPNYFAFLALSSPFMNYGWDLGTVINSMVLMVVILLAFRRTLSALAAKDVYAT